MIIHLENRCAKLKVGDKVLLRHTAFKGKHKIQDRWEYIIYEVIEQPVGKMPVFKVKPIEGDGKMKVVHRNLLLPLSSDHTSKLDTESMVDQAVNMHGIIAAGAFTSHVQNMSAFSKAWVVDMFPQGVLQQLVTTL